MNTYILLKKIALFYNKKICDFLPFKQLFFFWNSSYVRNEIIIKFRPQALRLNLLCYQYPGPPFNKENGDKPLNTLPEWFRSALMSQRFYVDDLIADSSLLRTIKSFGGDTLRRITFANPCADTISISRYGDTLKSDIYLWMVLHLSNDTSVVNCCYTLLFYHFNLIELAEPNYYGILTRQPNDDYFLQQNDYNLGAIGISEAWDATVSNESILVGVVDGGVDLRHCEFNTEQGVCKIAGGWSYDDGNGRQGSGENLYRVIFKPGANHLVSHGTGVCGIIGALTNRECPTGFRGMAGIAGGWGPEPGPIGSKIIPYRVAVNIQLNGIWQDVIELSNVVGAILELSGQNPRSGFGEGVHIINLSLSFPEWTESLRSAINFAYTHGVSVVCSRGNLGSFGYNDPVSRVYPSTYPPQNWLISVGGSNATPFDKKQNDPIDDYMNLAHGSMCGNNMDIIAPNVAVFTTSTDGSYYDYFDDDPNNNFGGTSVAAAHTSGILALLRSYGSERGWDFLEPEDYEGMLKASSLDRNPDNIANDNYMKDRYKFFYDEVSGWGHLRADKLFEMFRKGYRVSHYKVYPMIKTSEETTVGDFQIVIKPASKNDNEETDYYYCKVIKWKGIFNIPTDKWIVNNDNKLFVWGRSGRSDQAINNEKCGGYPPIFKFPPNPSLSVPTYWTGYTEVLGGGGNGLTNGIIASGTSIEVITYQYALKKNQNEQYKYYPRDDEICGYISVFGLEIETPSIIQEQSYYTKGLNVSIQMDAKQDVYTLTFKLVEDCNLCIQVYNVMGQLLYERLLNNLSNSFHSIELPTDIFTNGLYFIKVSTSIPNTFKVLKFFCVK